METGQHRHDMTYCSVENKAKLCQIIKLTMKIVHKQFIYENTDKYL